MMHMGFGKGTFYSFNLFLDRPLLFFQVAAVFCESMNRGGVGSPGGQLLRRRGDSRQQQEPGDYRGQESLCNSRSGHIGSLNDPCSKPGLSPQPLLRVEHMIFFVGDEELQLIDFSYPANDLPGLDLLALGNGYGR
jgi:hypothetical protein